MEINKLTFKKKTISKFVAVVIISGSISLVGNVGRVNAQPNEKSINVNYSKENQINGWVKEDNNWYYYENGNKKTGWLKDRDGSWYWLGTDGKMVSNQILNIKGTYYRFLPSGRMSNKSNLKIAKVNQCDYLNVRSGPSTNSSIVAKTYTNDTVEVSESSNGWSKVELENSNIGWVNSNYITLQGKENNSNIQKVIDLSKKQIGKPYVWGASGPNGFDCSGLIYYSYKNGGNKTLPRTSREQSTVGVKVEKSNLQPGDLVFFNTSGVGISHVGMYIGNNEFIHSTQPGDTVKVHKINSAYYNRTFVTARRVMA